MSLFSETGTAPANEDGADCSWFHLFRRRKRTNADTRVRRRAALRVRGSPACHGTRRPVPPRRLYGTAGRLASFLHKRETRDGPHASPGAAALLPLRNGRSYLGPRRPRPGLCTQQIVASVGICDCRLLPALHPVSRFPTVLPPASSRNPSSAVHPKFHPRLIVIPAHAFRPRSFCP